MVGTSASRVVCLGVDQGGEPLCVRPCRGQRVATEQDLARAARSADIRDQQTGRAGAYVDHPDPQAAAILRAVRGRRGPGRAFSAVAVSNFCAATDRKGHALATCRITGLTVPECSCGRCTERLLAEFAPDRLTIRRALEPALDRDPSRPLIRLPLHEARSRPPVPPVSERLRRPAL